MCGGGSHRDREGREGVAAPGAATATETCPNCGSPVAADFVLCPRCGTQLKRSCPSCRRAVGVDWVACPYCGADLQDA